jgi:hypothetical protein
MRHSLSKPRSRENLAIPRFLCVAAAFALVLTGFAQQDQKPNASAQQSSADKELYFIGQKLAKAVLNKDIPTLLSYDRDDLRAEDEVSLKNPKSGLYCYLLDSSCIDGGKWRSVYDKLSNARQLRIKVSTRISPTNSRLYGNVLFFDSASISEADLKSSKFLCHESPTRIAFWTFSLENGKWKAVTPLFGAETNGLCGG